MNAGSRPPTWGSRAIGGGDGGREPNPQIGFRSSNRYSALCRSVVLLQINERANEGAPKAARPLAANKDSARPFLQCDCGIGCSMLGVHRLLVSCLNPECRHAALLDVSLSS